MNLNKSNLRRLAKSRRVWSISLPLPFSNSLVLKFRKFKTSKVRRSPRYFQVVLPLYFLPAKELAICHVHKAKSKKRKHSKQLFFAKQFSLISVFLIVLGACGLIYFGQKLTASATPQVDQTNASQASATPAPQPSSGNMPKASESSNPVRLRIAKLGIDTSFVPLGRKADGTMQVPEAGNTAGWYTLAPTPGQLGPAIVVGHLDTTKGVAVFWRLHELQPGDIIEIDRADGKTARFQISAVKQFDQNNFPTQEVYGNIDFAGIRLITCGGVFDRQTHHYSQNTVAYGALVI